MILDIDHSYCVAGDLVFSFSRDVLVEEYFTTEEKVSSYSSEVFSLIRKNYKILTQEVCLNAVDSGPHEDLFTTVESELRRLSRRLVSKGVSSKIREIFQREVMEKLDVICAVDPKMFYHPKLFTNHLKILKTLCFDDKWCSSHLDTEDKVQLFAESFFHLLSENKEYLLREKTRCLLKTISASIKTTLMASVFNEVVQSRLPELIEEGKRERRISIEKKRAEILSQRNALEVEIEALEGAIELHLARAGDEVPPQFQSALQMAREAKKPTQAMSEELSEVELDFVTRLKNLSWRLISYKIGIEELGKGLHRD